MRLFDIPFIANYKISKSGHIFNMKGKTEAKELPTYFHNYKMVNIEGIPHRVDELIMQTYYGPINFPIEYLDGHKKCCEFENLKYRIDKVEEIDNFIYLNDISIPFKLIPGSEYEYLSMNGVLYSKRTGNIKPIHYLNSGYCCCNITSKNFNVSRLYTHRLVYITWIGPIPEDLVIDHLDGRKWNNDIFNLEPVTSGENNRRAFREGLKSLTYSDEIIHVICRMMEINSPIQDIYHIMNAHTPEEKKRITILVYNILNGKSRNDIASQYDFSKYDVKKNHYLVLDDKSLHAVCQLLIDGKYSQYKIGKMFDVSRSKIEAVKTSLRKEGLIA